MDHQRNIITPDARKFVFTRRLPRTGQTTSYQAGDDGDYEAGWDIGQRFLTKTLSGDVVVCDRATGLMWPRAANSAGGNNGALITWADAIIYCEALNFAGFTDWRLPNLNELFTLYNHGQGGPGVFPRDWPEFALSTNPMWSSTTLTSLPTEAWIFRLLSAGNICYRFVKTNSANLLAVRRFL